MYIALRMLGSAVTSVLEWFAKAHHGLINFQDFEKAVVKALRQVEVDPKEEEEWLGSLNALERLAATREGTGYKIRYHTGNNPDQDSYNTQELGQ